MPNPRIVLGVYQLNLIIIRLRLGGDHVDRDRLEECDYIRIGTERRGIGGVVIPGQRIGVHVRLVRRGAIPQSSVVLYATSITSFQWCPSPFTIVQPFFVLETISPSLH